MVLENIFYYSRYIGVFYCYSNVCYSIVFYFFKNRLCRLRVYDRCCRRNKLGVIVCRSRFV